MDSEKETDELTTPLSSEPQKNKKNKNKKKNKG